MCVRSFSFVWSGRHVHGFTPSLLPPLLRKTKQTQRTRQRWSLWSCPVSCCFCLFVCLSVRIGLDAWVFVPLVMDCMRSTLGPHQGRHGHLCQAFFFLEEIFFKPKADRQRSSQQQGGKQDTNKHKALLRALRLRHSLCPLRFGADMLADALPPRLTLAVLAVLGDEAHAPSVGPRFSASTQRFRSFLTFFSPPLQPCNVPPWSDSFRLGWMCNIKRTVRVCVWTRCTYCV